MHVDFVGLNLNVNRPHGRSRRRWGDNINMDMKEVE